MRLRATLYTKPGCHLCEATLAELGRLRARHPHDLELVDITLDDGLMRRYGERIPVLEVGGHEYDAPLERAVLEQALLRAAAKQLQASRKSRQDQPAPSVTDEGEGGPQ